VNEELLAEQCKRRDEVAEREVFSRYAPMLRGICCRYAVDADEAEDMFQEGFVRIFDTIGSFKWVGDGSLAAWMRRVMVNNAINYYKKQKRHRLTHVEHDDETARISDDDGEVADEDSFGFSGVLAAGITKQVLLEMLQQLPEMYRVVFNLAVIDGLRHKDIASMLGIDESSSRSRLMRSKTMLKASLKDYVLQVKRGKVPDEKHSLSAV